MAITKTQIANMALAHLGPELSVSNFETDQSREANVARTFYKQTLREVLTDCPWPFATIFAPLTLVEWYFSRERRFAYAYPANCLRVRRLFSPMGYNRNDDVRSRQKYKIIQTPVLTPSTMVNGVFTPGVPVVPYQLVKVILADEPHLQVEYTADDELVTDYTAQFVAAVSWKLAFYMAPALTGGDPYKLGERAMANYVSALNMAEAEALNEEVPDEVRAGEFIDGRQNEWGSRWREGYGPGAYNTPDFPSGYTVENS